MAEVERDAAGYTPGQIKALKIAIAIMTFAIVAGLLVLVLTIVYRATNYKQPISTSSAGGTDLRSLYPGAGVIAEGKLPEGAHVVAISPWGERLVLAVEDGMAIELLALDPKSGKIEPLASLQRTP